MKRNSYRAVLQRCPLPGAERLLLPVVVCILVLCLPFDEKRSGQPTPANCTTCHDFPGSPVCRSDSLVVSGTTTSLCYRCHLGAVVVDSSGDSATNTLIYHDRMMTTGDGLLRPATDTAHTDLTVTTRYTGCTFCHEFPPSATERDSIPGYTLSFQGHPRHVKIHFAACAECHGATIEADAAVHPVSNLFEVSQQSIDVVGGDTVPVVNEPPHRNRSTDVVFLEKLYRSKEPGIDTQFIWHPESRSCSNVLCHGDPSTSDTTEFNRYRLTYWK